MNSHSSEIKPASKIKPAGTSLQADKFPWQALLGFMLGRLRLSPQDFWSMSMPELNAMMAHLTEAHTLSSTSMGAVKSVRSMDLHKLDALMKQFPD